MTSMPSVDTLQANESATYEMLIDHLRRGELMLVLGAGYSLDLGMPNWTQLVKEALNRAGKVSLADCINKRTTSAELQQMMNDVEPRNPDDRHAFGQYMDLIKDSLYSNGHEYRKLLVGNPLWVALGALMMGSRRGSISRVITFNFDDALEWYLRTHGFTSQVITEIPTLRYDADVAVVHPYGYIPSDDTQRASNFIVLSKRSFERWIAPPNSPWRELFREMLLEKIGLFVGFSGNDDVFKAIARDVSDTIKESRPVGYWLRGPEDYSGAEELDANTKKKKQAESDKELCDYGFVPIRMEDYAEWPSFLLRLCEDAAIKHNESSQCS